VRVLIAGVLSLSACTGDTTPDSGIVDTGPGPDGCYDVPFRGDTGVNVAPCDPNDGTGCDTSTLRYCVWDFEEDNGKCRCLGDEPKALGENCSMPLQNCSPGLSCLNIEGAPKCYQVCTQADPAECEAISDPMTTFLCYPIQRGDESITLEYGLCVGQAACDPLDDKCASDETCSLVNARLNACEMSGMVPFGGDCTMENCMKGGVCVGLVDPNGNPLGTKCYQPCDFTMPMCMTGTCMNVGIEGYGICF
jgi:hypothetical protein